MISLFGRGGRHCQHPSQSIVDAVDAHPDIDERDACILERFYDQLLGGTAFCRQEYEAHRSKLVDRVLVDELRVREYAAPHRRVATGEVVDLERHR